MSNIGDYNEDGTRNDGRMTKAEYLEMKNAEYIDKLTPRQMAHLGELDDILLDGGRVWANYGRARLYTHGGFWNLDNGKWTEVIEEEKLYAVFDDTITLTLPEAGNGTGTD